MRVRATTTLDQSPSGSTCSMLVHDDCGSSESPHKGWTKKWGQDSCTHAVSNAYTSGDFQGEAALGSIAVFSATWEIPLLDGVTGASAIIANSLTVVVNCGAGAAGAE